MSSGACFFHTLSVWSRRVATAGEVVMEQAVDLVEETLEAVAVAHIPEFEHPRHLVIGGETLPQFAVVRQEEAVAASKPRRGRAAACNQRWPRSSALAREFARVPCPKLAGEGQPPVRPSLASARRLQPACPPTVPKFPQTLSRAGHRGWRGRGCSRADESRLVIGACPSRP